MATLLIITIFIPLAGAVVLFALPKLDYRCARQIALGCVLATLALSVLMAGLYEPDGREFQFVARSSASESASPVYGTSWLAIPGSTGIRVAFGLDGVSLTLFVLTALLMVPSVFASWESIRDRAATHYAHMLALATGLLGLFAALDIILFYVFFEFILIPMFFLIGIYGGPERRRAAIYFFLYTLAGSLLTLVGVLAMVFIHWQHGASHTLTFSIPELTRGLASLPWASWQEAAISWRSPQALIFLLLFAGFAVKVPLFPFHTWLPLAHVEAPTAGSILLAGVLLKVGSYGMYRFNLGMTPQGAVYWMPLVLTLAVIAIIYGALTALAQTDVKRLVAYSSVSHMGFIVLGLFSLTTTGINGAVIQMVNHGVTTGALFACVGVFYERYHTREMSDLSGLWERLPVLAFFFMLSALGSAAVPGLNGFVGEFPILVGMFSRNATYAVLAVPGMLLGAYYLIHMLDRIIYNPLREPGGHAATDHGHATASEPTSADAPALIIPRLGWHEVAGLAPLMVLIVAIGVYPRPIFNALERPVRDLAQPFPPVTSSHDLGATSDIVVTYTAQDSAR